MDLGSTFTLGSRLLGGCCASVMVLASSAAVSQSLPTSGPAENGQPEWFIYQAPAGGPGGAGGRGGFTPRPTPPIAECAADSAKLGISGPTERNELMKRWKEVSPACVNALALPTITETTIDRSGTPTCVRSVMCMSSNGQGISWNVNPSGLYNGTNNVQRVQWRSNPVNLGYKPVYPYSLIQGANGAVSVGVDSKDNVWVIQRAPVGVDAISKFDANGKLLFTLGDKVIGHFHKAHGMNVDANDNAYFADPSGAVILKISPEGKVLKTFGTRGKRGDWDEAKGQRLLWQPLDVAFAPNGGIYIAQGHANESPNDAGLSPDNRVGAARILHLDRNGKFLSQWYGNQIGPGKFSMAHGIAVDPKNGDVWIGDREEYRLVVYTSDGKFKKTIQMRNLMCAIAFDPKGDLWVSTGRDGQLLKLDREGRVLGAVGNGSGLGTGQFIEATYMAWDKNGNIYSGDTSVGRVTRMIAPH